MAACNQLQDTLKRKLAVAKAARGYSWQDIAAIMTRCGVPISANHLMAKMSRGSFKATEFLLLMRLLGMHSIELGDVEIPELDEALLELESKRHE